MFKLNMKDMIWNPLLEVFQHMVSDFAYLRWRWIGCLTSRSTIFQSYTCVCDDTSRSAGELKKKLDLRSGSQRHRHFVGFFCVPVLAPTWGHSFYMVIPRNRPIWSPFTTRWGYGGHLDLTPPPPPPGDLLFSNNFPLTHYRTYIEDLLSST